MIVSLPDAESLSQCTSGTKVTWKEGICITVAVIVMITRSDDYEFCRSFVG